LRTRAASFFRVQSPFSSATGCPLQALSPIFYTSPFDPFPPFFIDFLSTRAGNREGVSPHRFFLNFFYALRTLSVLFDFFSFRCFFSPLDSFPVIYTNPLPTCSSPRCWMSHSRRICGFLFGDLFFPCLFLPLLTVIPLWEFFFFKFFPLLVSNTLLFSSRISLVLPAFFFVDPSSFSMESFFVYFRNPLLPFVVVVVFFSLPLRCSPQEPFLKPSLSFKRPHRRLHTSPWLLSSLLPGPLSFPLILFLFFPPDLRSLKTVSQSFSKSNSPALLLFSEFFFFPSALLVYPVVAQ